MSNYLLDWVTPILFWTLLILNYTVRPVRNVVKKRISTPSKTFVMCTLKDFVTWLKSLKYKIFKLGVIILLINAFVDSLLLTIFNSWGDMGAIIVGKAQNSNIMGTVTIRALLAMLDVVLTFLKAIGIITMKTIMPYKVDTQISHGVYFTIAIIILIILIRWVKHLFREKEIWDEQNSNR